MKKIVKSVFASMMFISLVFISCDFVYSGTVDLNLRKLNSIDNGARKEAAKDLKYYGTKKVVRALKNALGDPNGDVRKEAANSLGYIGDPSAVESLIFVLSDSDMGVRGAAAGALGKIADPRAIQPLDRLAEKDWNPIIKKIASESAQNCRLAKYRAKMQSDTESSSKKPAGKKSKTVKPEPEKSEELTAQTQSQPIIPVRKSKMAVLLFKDIPAQENVVYGQVVSDMISTGLLESNQFEVFDRIQTKKMIEEKNLNVGNSVDPSTAVELGKILGVEYIVTGNVAKLGDLYETDVRMIETKQGKTVIAENGSSKGEENLRGMSKSICDKLVAKYVSLPKTEEKDNK